MAKVTLTLFIHLEEKNGIAGETPAIPISSSLQDYYAADAGLHQ